MLHSHRIIQDDKDRTEAYEEYFPYHLKAKTPHVIALLNDIGERLLRDEPVELVCKCGNRDYCHGNYLCDLINRRIDEALLLSP